ncbi:MAG: hypothetical protein WD690_11770 [Vicinamibacterales bacterium]
MHPSLIGAVLMALVTTAGDYVWFEFGVRHTPLAGILHGIVLMGVLGAFLGSLSRRIALGAIGGVAAGVIGALTFYALWRVLGWGAMFASWSLLWLLLAAFDGLVLRRPGVLNLRASMASARSSWVVRGLIAAIAGGIAFYAVSGVWTSRGEHPNYGWHFVAWLIAWWPGLAALTFGRRP